MPHFAHHGHRLFYREQGEGTLLMILPGNTASSACYEGELNYFSRRYRAVALDFAGTGASDRLETLGDDWWERSAYDVCGLIQHLGEKQAILLGSSGGAVIAPGAVPDAAYRLMEALIFFPAVYVTSIFPVFSTLYVSSQKPLKSAYEKSFKYLTILSLPIAVGITLLADQIILLIFKSAYIPSILTLQILIWVLPFSFVNYMLGSLLTSMNRQITLLKITICSLAVTVVLNLVFIPMYSYLGAAVVTVATDAFAVALSFYVASKLVSKIKIHQVIFKPAVACLIMGLFILLFKSNLFIVITLSVIIYFAALILLKTFTPEDYDLFRQILNIKRGR